MSKKKRIEKDKGLIFIRKRYLELIQGYLDKAKDGMNYDDSLIPCFPLMASSIEAFSNEVELFLQDCLKNENLVFKNNLELQKIIKQIKYTLHVISLGKYEPFNKVKIFASILTYCDNDKIAKFEEILKDIRRIRNLIIHPSLVHYLISLELPSDEDNSNSIESGIIDLGTIVSEYPGKEKIRNLFKNKFIDKEELGIDVYSYFSKKDIVEFFYTEILDFFNYFENKISNESIKREFEIFMHNY